MVKETSLKKGLQTLQYFIESTELEGNHEDHQVSFWPCTGHPKKHTM